MPGGVRVNREAQFYGFDFQGLEYCDLKSGDDSIKSGEQSAYGKPVGQRENHSIDNSWLCLFFSSFLILLKVCETIYKFHNMVN